jgi:hypothetical protein
VDYFPGTKLPDRFDAYTPADMSDADKIRRIAEQFHLQIESLPEELESRRYPRGRSYSHSASNVLDEIVANYPDMQWTVAAGVLRAGKTSEGEPLSDFERAGQLMRDLRPQRGANRRLSPDQIAQIGRTLDAEHIDLNKILKQYQVVLLKAWNVKRAKQAVKTFCDALEFKRTELTREGRIKRIDPRRWVLQRLLDAEKQFSKNNPHC